MNAFNRAIGRLSVAAQPGSEPIAEEFNLTGRTGSLFYMAPEVQESKKSNEKVESALLCVAPC